MTVGVGATRFGLLQALRDHRRRLRRHIPERDQMVLVNTWGDRGQDTRIAAPFIRREIAAASRLGATHLQLDDGWQSGQSSNSADDDPLAPAKVPFDYAFAITMPAQPLLWFESSNTYPKKPSTSPPSFANTATTSRPYTRAPPSPSATSPPGAAGPASKPSAPNPPGTFWSSASIPTAKARTSAFMRSPQDNPSH